MKKAKILARGHKHHPNIRANKTKNTYPKPSKQSPLHISPPSVSISHKVWEFLHRIATAEKILHLIYKCCQPAILETAGLFSILHLNDDESILLNVVKFLLAIVLKKVVQHFNQN